MQDRETQTGKHTRIALEFLEAADRFFEQGDIIQTSEKLWGATNHAAKVLCIRRRWRHGKYAHIREAVRLLAEETGDESIMDGYLIAHAHHLNFYTDAMEAEEADPARPRIRRLVEKLLAAAGHDSG